MKNLNNFLQWLKPTLVGEDDKLSLRRLTVVHFIILLTWMVVKTASGAIFPEITWVVVSGGAGLFSSLSIWQQKVNKETGYIAD
jgi:hypothetical protein